MCKRFDAACEVLAIDDFLIKNFRRAFINRNKYQVAQVDLINIVGQSSLIDKKDVTAPERAIQAAVGHTDIGTTASYAWTQPAQLAHIFTKTSRWPRVSASPEEPGGPDRDTRMERHDELQRLLAQTLEELARVGVTMGTR